MRSAITLPALFFILILSFGATSLSSVRKHRGRCPSIDVQQNFNAKSYMGLWYEQAHYNTQQYEGEDARCVTAHYALNGTTGVVNVTNVAIAKADKSDSQVSISGTAVLDDPGKDEGKLTVTFNIAGFDVESMYWVLGTDYDNYSVVYACSSHKESHNYTVWYLGRSQTFDTTADRKRYFKNTNQVLRSHGLKPSVMKSTQQTDCSV